MTDVPDEFPLPQDVYERHRKVLSIHAGGQSERRSKLRRAGIAAVLVATALAVTPAFGVNGRLFDLVRGQPASTQVKAYFASNDRAREEMFAHAGRAGLTLHDRFSPAMVDETRGILAVQSPDGPIFLWATQTEDGRQCWLLQAMTTPGGSGSCDGSSDGKAMRPETLWTEERPSVTIVHVRIYDDAISQVSVAVDRAPDIPLQVAGGHALGTVPREDHIDAIVGRNRDGEEVSRVEWH
jgi:hypothetical protein